MEYVNKNSHIAAVKNNDGQLQRLAPGEVVNADGAFADALSSCPGIEQASSSDKKAWESRNDTTAVADASPTPGGQINQALVELRAAAGKFLAATNQIVIGDDQAPYGPSSGVVTTVDAVKDHEHFGPLSATHVGKVDDVGTAEGKLGGVEQASGAEVHNSQVEAHRDVADVSQALAGLHAGAEPSDGDGDDYDDLTGDELDAELKARGLTTTGKVAEKRDRLREDDAESGADDADADDADDSNE